MLLGGDVVVISVTNSPEFYTASAELETLASEIAAKAIVVAAVPLESISVTFFEGEISEEADKQRVFIFLVKDNKAVLQPILSFDATGPITLAEFEVFFANMERPLGEEQEKCVLKEVETRSRAIGDPETLDPTTVALLPAEQWQLLDQFGKRLILMQVISTEALFICTKRDKEGR
jgi:hypothetical protein